MTESEMLNVLNEYDRATIERGVQPFEAEYVIDNHFELKEGATLWNIRKADNSVYFSLIEHADGILLTTDDWQCGARCETPDEIEKWGWIELYDDRFYTPCPILNGLPRLPFWH